MLSQILTMQQQGLPIQNIVLTNLKTTEGQVASILRMFNSLGLKCIMQVHMQGNEYKLNLPHFTVDSSFFPRSINLWNKLPITNDCTLEYICPSYHFNTDSKMNSHYTFFRLCSVHL